MTPNLLLSLSFLRNLLRLRLSEYLGQGGVALPSVPVLQDDAHPFTRFVQQKQLTVDEFVVLVAALVPHLQPHLFDEVVQDYFPQGGDFPALGGIKGTNFRGLLPTGETVQFILGGASDIHRRIDIQKVFSNDHFFRKEGILSLEQMKPGEPVSSGKMVLDPEYVERFTTGGLSLPQLSSTFPAQHLRTALDWSDLVLNPSTASQLTEIEIWLQHHETLAKDWKMLNKVKPGYLALFYGPPGTGKTMAVSLLGKNTGHEVFRIDLSTIVSKYIGETEKNLSALFERAENKNWILFFDEADALFGKRTNVRDAHDRYANQEISYLLQRVEDFNGLCILASNFKNNIDDAFVRRFQSIVYFPMPKAEERLLIWKKTFPDAVVLEKLIDLNDVARKYELSGSNILNIVQYCCLQALAAGTNIITAENLLRGIRRELAKENKIV